MAYTSAILIFVLGFTAPASACVGARPMAMGGTFIAVSDDANATYWNPAGLTQVESPEFTYTPTIHNRDEYNYDDFVSLVTPINISKQNWGSLGLSFINTGYKDSAYDFDEHWYWLSYAKSLLGGLSVGVNLRYQDFDYKISPGWIVGGVSGPARSKDHTSAVDLSLLYRTAKFSLGILWQDLNEPGVELFSEKSKYISNLRPGIAFRPDDKTVLALDMYDATGETKNQAGSVAYDLRAGIERWFDLPEGTPTWLGNSFALRAGGYHFNRGNRAYTFGVGIKGPPDPEEKFLKNIEFDYTLMYWTDTAAGMDEFTHQIGLTFQF
ncbi:MAG: hypothetical protein A3K83_06355 [Omnitrophica WOR_2 bacterium RBG_13_44_8b]|nr:MAG: hypothetical protein A3K83_06355 [Omnitrophica WOR_2 bacterium RBG_13_44_8b]